MSTTINLNLFTLKLFPIDSSNNTGKSQLRAVLNGTDTKVNDCFLEVDKNFKLNILQRFINYFTNKYQKFDMHDPTDFSKITGCFYIKTEELSRLAMQENLPDIQKPARYTIDDLNCCLNQEILNKNSHNSTDFKTNNYVLDYIRDLNRKMATNPNHVVDKKNSGGLIFNVNKDGVLVVNQIRKSITQENKEISKVVKIFEFYVNKNTNLWEIKPKSQMANLFF